MAANARTRQRSDNSHASGFNVDARAARRAEGVVTIGGVEYHRRLKDHALSRKVRDLSAQQDQVGARVQALNKELEADEDGLDRDGIEADIRKLGDEWIELSYTICGELLVDAENKAPTKDHLHKWVDQFEDLAPLMSYLIGGTEPVEGPTPTATSSG